MFKQKCFIRLSTPKIVDRLHRLGGGLYVSDLNID